MLGSNDFKLMKKSGCGKLSYGLESGSDEMLKLINKNLTRERMIKGLKRISKYNVTSKFFFMIGFPGEQFKHFYETVDMVYKIRKYHPCGVVPAPRFYTPYPGTTLYSKCKELGFKVPNSLEGWAVFDYSKLMIPWVNEEFKRQAYVMTEMLPYVCVKTDNILLKIFSYFVTLRFKNHFFYFPDKLILNFLKNNKYLKKIMYILKKKP